MADEKKSMISVPSNVLWPLLAGILGAGVGGGGVGLFQSQAVTHAELAERDYITRTEVEAVIEKSGPYLSDKPVIDLRLKNIEAQNKELDKKMDKVMNKLGIVD